jgi:hypothetical protein
MESLINMSAQDHNSLGSQAKVTEKTHAKLEFRFEYVFETRALACNKMQKTQGSCHHSWQAAAARKQTPASMMRENPFSISRFLILSFTLGLAAASTFGQENTPPPIGYPRDWSHRHLIFSKPKTQEDLERVQRDPRYLHQLGYQASKKISSEGKERFEPLEVEQDKGNEDEKETRHHAMEPGIHADWSMSLGSNSATVGADNFPAKYSFSAGSPTTANCDLGTSPDFVVYNTGLTGSSSQASIIAYDNLYSGLCSGAVPRTYWAYNTGGPIQTSVVLSLDGKQVAFIHSKSPAQLVILKWLADDPGTTATAPRTLAAVANSAYRGCSAPCMTTITFNKPSLLRSADNTTSSPFCDYTNDLIYVGDAGGFVHKFTGVFIGTPAEVTSGWPVDSGSAKAIPGVVYDSASNLVYAPTQASNLAEITPGGALTVSASITGTACCDLQEGPIVDSTNGKVYVFVQGKDAFLNTGPNYIDQFATNFAPNANPLATVNLGANNSFSSSSKPLYAGGFDHSFYSTGTGNLYVCGNTPATPILYQIPITAGAMSATASAGPTLTSANTLCSPVTEFYNSSGSTPRDSIFLGVRASGLASGCSSAGCVMGVNVTSWLPSTSYSVGQFVVDTHFNIEVVTAGGTSGATQPNWPGAGSPGTTRTDNTVTWTSEGPFTFAAFANSNSYAVNKVIVDSNGNLERVTSIAGTGESQSSGTPTWATTFGSTTTSTFSSGNSVTFTNQGPSGIIGTQYNGSTSGIVVDNSSTAAGASNIYFSTLGTAAGTCSSNPNTTGGCAIQASQIAP